jgi:hypothetical protein
LADEASRSTPKHVYRNYYRCHGRSDKGAEACPRVKGERADVIEAFAWNFVRDLLLDPDRLRPDLDALLDHLESVAPEELDALSPEERHEVYKVLGLGVVAREDGKYEASIDYIGYKKSPDVCNTASVCAYSQ